MPHKTAVLGAGVIGLAAGIRLLEEIQDIEVTIYADLTGNETTSRGSGGLWQPYSLGDTPGHLVLRWGGDTLKHLLSIFNSAAGATAGTQLISGYQLWQEYEADPIWKDVPPSFRHLTPRELATFPDSTWKHGWKWTTVITDMQMYMHYLMQRFIQAGGELRHQTIGKLAELADYDILVNCGGLRAGKLFGDDKVIPVRGQVLRVEAPWVKHFYYGTSQYYILPNVDTVVLGGTTQKNNWDTDVSQEDSARIMENVCKIVPSLKGAKVVREWVGLRPYREPVRLELQHHEAQLPDGSTKRLPVVHNYGHGGSGVTLHWGCAADAVQLVRKHLSGTQHTASSAKL